MRKLVSPSNDREGSIGEANLPGKVTQYRSPGNGLISHRRSSIKPHDSDIGTLISYGSDLVDQFRRVAGYVDRILKGEKPSNLPVQAPVKYELVVNLKLPKRWASRSHRHCSPAPTR